MPLSISKKPIPPELKEKLEQGLPLTEEEWRRVKG